MLLHSHSKHDLNIRSAFLHMLADGASSVGVIGAGLVIWFTGWKQADPLAAAIISVIILGWCVSLLRSSCRILLEAAPAHVDLEEVRAAMKGVSGVAEVHDLHVWTITSRMYALTAHVRLTEDLAVSRAGEIGHRLRRILDERWEIDHSTLQFEAGQEQGQHDPKC
jgi:cobalt-zinc-cadmium efflux system protein